jgi:hypothetical protein
MKKIIHLSDPHIGEANLGERFTASWIISFSTKSQQKIIL